MQALDILSTIIGLENGLTEANPFAAWGLGEFGYAFLFVAKAAGVFLIWKIYRAIPWARVKQIQLWALTSLMGAVVVNNLWHALV